MRSERRGGMTVPRESWVSGVLLIAVAGCASFPGTARVPTRQPLPVELAAYYRYDRQPLQATIDSTERRSGYLIKRLHLALSGSTSPPIRIDWYEPNHSQKSPAVLMSPILAGDDLYVREFAQFYAARGLHTLIVYRPKEVFSADRGLQDIETHFHESVIQLRHVIDWCETQEFIDPQRIGSFAISMGAILTTLLAAVEPRLSAYVLGLPAGQVPDILMASQDKAIRKRRKAYLERHGWNHEEGLRQLRATLVSEPMRFAPAIDPSKALVIVGLFDRVLGFKRSLDLWAAMGRPELIVLPTGHYTAYLATPYLKIVTYSFLKRSLRSKE